MEPEHVTCTSLGALLIALLPLARPAQTEGFDGELKKKVGFLTSAPIVQSTIHSTDLR